MKLALTVAAAMLSLSLAGAAPAAPSLSYAAPQSDIAGAAFVDARFKVKKFGGHRGFRRGHFGKGFGRKSFRGAGYGHFSKGAFVKKSYGGKGKKVFFGKGLIYK